MNYTLRPSSASIWGKFGGCRAYPRMVSQYARGTSPEAEEGTAAHSIAEMFIRMLSAGLEFPQMEGAVAPNGVVITEEMIEGAEMYARIIHEELAAAGLTLDSEDVGLERQMSIPLVHESNGGTPDFWLYDKKRGVIKVFDFKFGMKLVEAFENYQLINYLAGLIGLYEINGFQDQHINVELHVVQPRAWHAEGVHRVDRRPLSSYRAHINNLRMGAQEAMGEGVARPGSHCINCDARHACEALRRSTQTAMHMTYEAEAHDLDGAALGLELSYLQRAADLMQYRITGLQAEVEARAARGEVVPGWSVAPAYGRKTWKNPEMIIQIGDLEGVDLRAEPKPVNLGEAKKRGLKQETIDKLTHSPSKGKKLKFESGALARKCFS